MRSPITTTGRALFLPDASRPSASTTDLQGFVEKRRPSTTAFPTQLFRSVRHRRRVTTAAASQCIKSSHLDLRHLDGASKISL